MKIPTRQDCIHNPVCKYNDQMCATDCGYFEPLSSDAVLSEVQAMKKAVPRLTIENVNIVISNDGYNKAIEDVVKKLNEHFR